MKHCFLHRCFVLSAVIFALVLAAPLIAQELSQEQVQDYEQLVVNYLPPR